MDDAEAALARTERLFQRQMIAASDYDKDRYAFYAAKATYAKAKADLEKILAGSWKEDIEIARAAVQLAESQVESIKINLERLIVRAPMDGEVLQLNVPAGPVRRHDLERADDRPGRQQAAARAGRSSMSPSCSISRRVPRRSPPSRAGPTSAST